ncbi:MAG: hypothetical protein EOP06_11460 [Proteobacteria bacterium]|nr:MAG: hypothetical protein EOP06_11460 [Pseudomonadota bacterium]
MRNSVRSIVAVSLIAGSSFAFTGIASAQPAAADTKPPSITLKAGSLVSNDLYKSVSYALADDVAVDFVEVNGVKKDLSNNRWSDLNGLRPGVFGAVEGLNTVVVVDTSGNRTSTTVKLDSKGPAVSVKPESLGGATAYRNLSLKLNDPAKVDRVVLNGVVKDLSDNVWSDLNGIKPGVFGAVEGPNTLVSLDVLGNSSTFTFNLDTTAPLVAERTQVYNPKQGGRTDVTLVFTEPVTGLPQGWNAVGGSATTYTKAFYSKVQAVTVTFVDVAAGNPGSYTFDYVPSSAPTAPQPEVPTIPLPSTGSSIFGS